MSGLAGGGRCEIDGLFREDETTSCDVDDTEVDCGLVKSMSDATVSTLTYKGWSALVNNRTIGRISNMLKSRS